jgi:hypothetical protein
MADNNEGEENTSRGNEWEVVLLTQSTYAAAPGPREPENYDKSDSNKQNQSEFSNDLIRSCHFEAVKTQDTEILPIDENRESKGSDSKMVEKEVGKSSGKDEDDLIFKGLDVPDEIFRTQQFEKEKGIAMSIHDTEFENDPNMQDSDLNDKERDMYSLPAFSDESALVESSAYGENTNTIAAEPDRSELGLDSFTDISQSSMPAKDGKFKGSDEAWWKSKAASFYAHAKETNTFWSIFIAAAVMGIVILGQKWQKDKWQTMQIKRQSSTNNESAGRITLPISRFKNVILGGHSRGSFMRSNANEMN